MAGRRGGTSARLRARLRGWRERRWGRSAPGAGGYRDCHKSGPGGGAADGQPRTSGTTGHDQAHLHEPSSNACPINSLFHRARPVGHRRGHPRENDPADKCFPVPASVNHHCGQRKGKRVAHRRSSSLTSAFPGARAGDIGGHLCGGAHGRRGTGNGVISIGRLGYAGGARHGRQLSAEGTASSEGTGPYPAQRF